MRTKKRKLHKSFNPEKYKMISCPSCGGTGKSSNGDEGAKVCSQCGGFGWVRKEGDHRALQKNIQKVVEREKYEWQTLRVQEDGKIKVE